MDTKQIMADTKRMIDDLKTVCGNFGLGNAPSEYKIITEIFLYKYLNDKFLYEIRLSDDKWKMCENLEGALNQMSEEAYDDLLDTLPASTAVLRREHLISYLFNHKNQKKTDGMKSFSEMFDDVLIEISNLNIQIFSVHAGGEDVIKLFDPISQYVIETGKRDEFCRAIIDKLVNFSFENTFAQKYDFFSTVYEYLIKDYNKDFGKYAEYYTPHTIASIISRIMIPNAVSNVTVYDPAAGSGTLVLALAHQIGEANCSLYTQDITQKSNEFLRLNLILNNLVHSLSNVVHGDTLLEPRHLNKRKNGLMQFDYIISNPPFNVDFSETRNTLAGESYKERFWAGVPKIPEKDKDSMQIYLLFIQHIIFSLKEGGKAAIVVPTPFLTKGKGIETRLREYLITKKYLRGVVTMPNNIFATTGTNVSVLFLEKKSRDEDVIFIEGSLLGDKSTESERNQKTVLSIEEQNTIVDTYLNKNCSNGFSVCASFDTIEKHDYRFSPSSYFEHKMIYKKYNNDEYSKMLSKKINKLKLFYSEELEYVLSEMFNYWFLQFEFPYKGGTYKSLGGKMQWNDDLGMEIPVGWQVLGIQKVCSIIDCLHSKKPDEVFESEDYYLLQLDNLLDDGRIDVSKKYYISEESYKEWCRRIEIKEGDFIVTNAGRAGAIGMVPAGVKCAIGRNLTAIRPNEVSSYYLRQFLFSPYMQKFLASNLDEGSFFKSFNVKSIKKIHVLIPPPELMDRYVEMVRPLIEKITNGITVDSEVDKIRKILKIKNS